MYFLLTRGDAHAPSGAWTILTLDDTGATLRPARHLGTEALADFVRQQESAPGAAGPPRWVWHDTSTSYSVLLAAGIRVQRCHDLRLCHTILRNSRLSAQSGLATGERSAWDGPAAVNRLPAVQGATLFDLDAVPQGPSDAHTEFQRQLAAVAGCEQPARIRLLLAAESAGALSAAEMRFTGLPWRVDVHERLLHDALGPRVPDGVRPDKLEQLAGEIRRHLNDLTLNPDSPPDLLRALNRAGLSVTSTQGWRLQELEHAVIEPLLRYKKLSRLLSANGWAWLETWIVDGRFHAEYLPGGVVTGRWAARGGGALQLPKQVRAAVVADPGWTFVVADAAQLEPRILAALSQDQAMALAGQGRDLYAGIVASGVVDTRDQAKVAMLGAMYGATTGQSGRLLPRLGRAYPRALGLTEDAARAGERGESVTTRLGRSSPKPSPEWLTVQARASEPDATRSDEHRARAQARDWGRFTRNFVVQGSAAEWALCWMADIRRQLWPASGSSHAALTRGAHLVFFLHDEVIVHTPRADAEHVAAVVARSAETAGRLLFGTFPVDFPLTVALVDSYADAK
ncbi:MAG: bifunctional 3'-5' exonuclease/DNA polymerase [Cryobacterium sp.]